MTGQNGRATRHPLPREMDADAMARGLSTAQHGFLRADPHGRKGKQAATHKSLENKGLVEQRGRFVRPTALGRHVLRHIEEIGNDPK